MRLLFASKEFSIMSRDSSYSGTITHLLRQLPNKDEQVVQDVFNFYFRRLAEKARHHLRNVGRVRVADEEDLAMLVLTAFLNDATAGELGELRSRHDVWRMLAKRTRLRAINMVRDEKRLRRDEVGESVFRDAHGGHDPLGIQNQAGRADHDIDTLHQELLSHLTDPLEYQVANLLLEGNDIPQIIELTGKSSTTIYRKIGRIKEHWLSSKPS
jgi:uncharacterized protein YerC